MDKFDDTVPENIQNLEIAVVLQQIKDTVGFPAFKSVLFDVNQLNHKELNFLEKVASRILAANEKPAVSRASNLLFFEEIAAIKDWSKMERFVATSLHDYNTPIIPKPKTGEVKSVSRVAAQVAAELGPR